MITEIRLIQEPIIDEASVQTHREILVFFHDLHSMQVLTSSPYYLRWGNMDKNS